MTVITGWLFTDAVGHASCPKCGAPTGQDCRTPKGRKAWPPHDERTDELVRRFGTAAPWSRKVKA